MGLLPNKIIPLIINYARGPGVLPFSLPKEVRECGVRRRVLPDARVDPEDQVQVSVEGLLGLAEPVVALAGEEVTKSAVYILG